MRVPDNKILREFRQPGPCLFCKRWCRWPECAHIEARGMGSGSRLDLRINLCRLGGAWECNCHGAHHAGREPTREQLFALVAARENCHQDAIRAALRDIRRLPRWASPEDVRAVLVRCGCPGGKT